MDLRIVGSAVDEFDELQELVGSADMNLVRQTREDENPLAATMSRQAKVNLAQWGIEPNDTFTPVGGTVAKLQAGAYGITMDNRGVHFIRKPIITDNIIDLNDTTSSEVLEGMKKFWDSEHLFRDLGMIYKRGVMLWGPPGSGKTVTVAQLMGELVARDGIVLLGDTHPSLTVQALQQLRRIEERRNLIVVLEDVDEIMYHHGEGALLSLLDGEHQVGNVVYVATTNYPEKLGARIINRPSRFDEVKKVGMPNDKARELYLRAVLKGKAPDEHIAQMVKDTNDLSIAHLRELVVAQYCLGRPYEETIDRLQKMCKPIKLGSDGFARKSFGLRPEPAVAVNEG